MSRSLVISNFILFQLGWFTCVMAGSGRWHILGSVIVACIVAYHLFRARYPVDEMIWLLFALIIGATWESLLVQTSVLEYHYGQISELVAPHWIIAMWALFASTLNVSLRWLRGRWILAIVFGALGGPLAFLAGEQLGAVVMPDQIQALISIGIGWGLLMPVLLQISTRFDGFKEKSIQTAGVN